MVTAAIFIPRYRQTLSRFTTTKNEGCEDGDGNEGVETVPSFALTGGITRQSRRHKNDNEEATDPPPPAPAQKRAHPKLTAVRNLPGLAGVTGADDLAALRLRSDAHWYLYRDAIATVLDSLRRSLLEEVGIAG